ncbi:MAG: hypothetical protein KME42_20600 [Tildeniella nuda ZEHNDER 1965/U140]|jgi:hypothetical protein|nr:hypothetical protein [Tildeniella nuda ZEHNDER 1965/U140]
MADSLPRTFTGWEIEALDRANELDRSNEANGKLQGKYIQWDLTNYDYDNDNRQVVGWTVFSGEDSAGRLVFTGVDHSTSCETSRRIPFPFGGTKIVKIPEPRINNQCKLTGLIELQPDEFGPSATYKIELSIRAKVIPGKRHVAGRDCNESLLESFTPCVIQVSTSTRLAFAAARDIEGGHDDEFDIKLDASTDAIDFNSLYPGQAVKVFFGLLGRRMTLEKVTLSKKEF